MSVSRSFVSRSFVCFVVCTVCLVEFGTAQVTPPVDFLGFEVGADFKLITYEQAAGYIELLESQTQRLKVFDAVELSTRI